MRKFLRDSRGSASVEFVALAIPLFLPVLIFINFFGQSSDAQASLRSLAREGARAYVTSESDAIGNQVIAEVMDVGGKALGFRDSVRYLVRCSQTPCIYPNGRVEVTVLARLKNSDVVEVTAIEYVSPWA